MNNFERYQQANFVYLILNENQYHIFKNKIGVVGVVNKETFISILNEIKNKFTDDSILEIKQLYFKDF